MVRLEGILQLGLTALTCETWMTHETYSRRKSFAEFYELSPVTTPTVDWISVLEWWFFDLRIKESKEQKLNNWGFSSICAVGITPILLLASLLLNLIIKPLDKHPTFLTKQFIEFLIHFSLSLPVINVIAHSCCCYFHWNKLLFLLAATTVSLARYTHEAF